MGKWRCVRIPAAVLEATRVQIEAGRIVIEPVCEKKHKLDDLLKDITKGNMHREIDFGSPEGREVWFETARRCSGAQ